jgi:tripartite-type tricarboxylate transporter receptor subunit TctC
MKLGSIRFTACLAAALALFSAGAWPQAGYPEKPIKIVVGFPPGTTGDVIARAMAPKLSAALGQQIVVENKAGAGSSIGAEAVARAPADGYTLLLSTIANTINPNLYQLSFNFEKDLVPVSMLAEAPALLVAHPSAPASLKDLIAAAKAKPGEIQYASSGNGTVTHLYGELFNLAAGAKLGHVPYKGSSQAVTDLMSGRIALLFSPASTVISHVKSGRLRALAVIGARRLPALPDVPTFAEAGVAGFESGLWFGLNAPAGTPRAVIERLNREAGRALALPDVKAILQGSSIEPIPGSSEAFAAFIREDEAKWARVVKTAGVSIQQ